MVANPTLSTCCHARQVQPINRSAELLDVRFKLARDFSESTGSSEAATTTLPSFSPVGALLLTCVDVMCLGTEGARKAATELAIASVLTTVPFMVTAQQQAVRSQESKKKRSQETGCCRVRTQTQAGCDVVWCKAVGPSS